MRLFILTLTKFLIVNSICFGQKYIETESTSKYDFTLEIEEHFLAQNDRVLNKIL